MKGQSIRAQMQTTVKRRQLVNRKTTKRKTVKSMNVNIQLAFRKLCATSINKTEMRK